MRSADGAIPSPPFDIVIVPYERRQFRDASGTLKTPAKPAAYYHFAWHVFVHLSQVSTI